jgi:hypothetical protein
MGEHEARMMVELVDTWRAIEHRKQIAPKAALDALPRSEAHQPVPPLSIAAPLFSADEHATDA